MLLTISTAHPPATELSYLLHKRPDRFQSFDMTFGKAHVFYPEGSPERCTACLMLDVDAVGMVRGKNPDQNFLLGCQANGKKVGPPILVVMNAKTGKVVANIPEIGGADEVAYSAKNGQYYSGSSNFQPGPVLGAGGK